MFNPHYLSGFIVSILFLTEGLSQVKADSYILTDSSGTVLAKKNETKLRPVASLTKVATALVVLEKLKESGNPGEMISVPPGALVGGANPLKLKTGDLLSVNDALISAILGSDNVSAYSLAEHFGGVDRFVKEMNELAKSLDMSQTIFINPHGLDLPDRQGKSTASDMARLGLAGTRSAVFMSICGMAKSTVSVSRRGEMISKTVSNTNHLLGKAGVDGMKTGTTRRAGACFIGAATLPNGKFVCVVLDSPDRFSDAAKLLEIAGKK